MAELQWIFLERPKLDTERWEWPAAIYRGPQLRHAAYLICEDAYHDVLVRAGNHRPISVVILRYNIPNEDPFKPRRMLYRDTQFRRIEHAIAWIGLFIGQNPDWHPILV